QVYDDRHRDDGSVWSSYHDRLGGNRRDVHGSSFDLHYTEVALGSPSFDVRRGHCGHDVRRAQLAAGSADDVPYVPGGRGILAELKVVFMARKHHLHPVLLKHVEPVAQHVGARSMYPTRIKRRMVEVWNFPRRSGGGERDRKSVV